jgi:hypothetical protein
MSKFVCRTLHPWEEVTQNFTFPSNFEHWFKRIAGADETTDYTHVNKWLETAQSGETLYVDDELRPVREDSAEIEIRCK